MIIVPRHRRNRLATRAFIAVIPVIIVVIIVIVRKGTS
jgi:hypothetical protein